MADCLEFPDSWSRFSFAGNMRIFEKLMEPKKRKPQEERTCYFCRKTFYPDGDTPYFIETDAQKAKEILEETGQDCRHGIHALAIPVKR